jgi:anthranilate phosphoribosyltransferase
LYHYLLQLERKEYVVAHSLDGYDEVSLTDDVQYYSTKGEKRLTVNDFGMPTLTQESLFGGETIDEAFNIFLKVIHNQGTSAQMNAVVANAAVGIQCFEQEKSLLECVDIAKNALEGGKTSQLLKNLIQNQN